MLREIPLAFCAYLLGCASGGLLVSLHRHVYRARVIDEFAKSLQDHARPLFSMDCSVPHGLQSMHRSESVAGASRSNMLVEDDTCSRSCLDP